MGVSLVKLLASSVDDQERTVAELPAPFCLYLPLFHADSWLCPSEIAPVGAWIRLGLLLVPLDDS